jgi:transcriptional regulator with XRE-family HTH domain
MIFNLHLVYGSHLWLYSVSEKEYAMGNILTSKELGEKLKEFRKRRGLTQEQLAERTDVTFQQIQQYENGKTRMNTDKLQAIAFAMSVPVAAFFGEVQGPLTAEEQKLINGYRALSSPEVRAFVMHSLSCAKSAI